MSQTGLAGTPAARIRYTFRRRASPSPMTSSAITNSGAYVWQDPGIERRQRRNTLEYQDTLITGKTWPFVALIQLSLAFCIGLPFGDLDRTSSTGDAGYVGCRQQQQEQTDRPPRVRSESSAPVVARDRSHEIPAHPDRHTTQDPPQISRLKSSARSAMRLDASAARVRSARLSCRSSSGRSAW